MWLHLYFKKNWTKQTCLSPSSRQKHIQRCMGMWMHDLPHLPCSNLALMAFMHEHVNVCSCIKTRKHKTNPNLNMWKSKWITSMWNRILKPQIYIKKRIQDRSIACKIKNEIRKIRVSGKDHVHAWLRLRAHNQACVRSQDYVHVGFSPETLATQKLK